MQWKIALIALTTLVGCGKNESIDCTYQLNVYEYLTEDGDYYATDNVVGYCFYADTSDYYIEDYASALSGKILSKIGQPEMSYNIKAEYNSESEALIFSNINAADVMFVVCDTTNMIYSFRNADMPRLIDTLYVELDIKVYEFDEDPTSIISTNGWKQMK